MLPWVRLCENEQDFTAGLGFASEFLSVYPPVVSYSLSVLFCVGEVM